MSITGKIIIDFQVFDNENPKVLIVDDSSLWKHIEDNPSIIEITLPGESEPRVITFGKNRRNIFTSVILGISCFEDCEENDYVDLPDGVYTITVKGSPDSFNKTRKFLKTSLLELELKQLFVTQGLECKDVSKSFLELKQEVDLYLKGAKSNITFNNSQKAFDLYNRACDAMQKLKDCKPCADA